MSLLSQGEFIEVDVIVKGILSYCSKCYCSTGRYYHPSDKMEQVTIHSLCGADRFSAHVEHTHMPLDGHCVSSSIY